MKEGSERQILAVAMQVKSKKKKSTRDGEILRHSKRILKTSKEKMIRQPIRRIGTNRASRGVQDGVQPHVTSDGQAALRSLRHNAL